MIDYCNVSDASEGRWTIAEGTEILLFGWDVWVGKAVAKPVILSKEIEGYFETYGAIMN